MPCVPPSLPRCRQKKSRARRGSERLQRKPRLHLFQLLLHPKSLLVQLSNNNNSSSSSTIIITTTIIMYRYRHRRSKNPRSSTSLPLHRRFRLLARRLGRHLTSPLNKHPPHLLAPRPHPERLLTHNTTLSLILSLHLCLRLSRLSTPRFSPHLPTRPSAVPFSDYFREKLPRSVASFTVAKAGFYLRRLANAVGHSCRTSLADQVDESRFLFLVSC